MYRSILVPLDGSAFGEQALPLAVGIARKAGATLRLAHVHAPLVYVEGLISLDSTMDLRARDEEKDYLEKVARRLTAKSDVKVTTALLDGPVPDALQEYALGQDVDLMVLTTHGRGPVSRFWLGSVADALMRRSATPLLLVRPPEKPAGTPTAEPAVRHVLVPLDGSALAEQILPRVTTLGRLTDAEYTLLRVVVPPATRGYDGSAVVVTGPDRPLLEQLQAEAWSYLEHVADRLRSQGLRVETRVLIDAHPAVAILDVAAARDSDLIALATHGRGGIERLLLGSVADKVVRGAQKGVLVFRPQTNSKETKGGRP